MSAGYTEPEPEQLTIPGTVVPKKTPAQEALEIRQAAEARLLEKKKAEELEQRKMIHEFLGEAMDYNQLTLEAQVLYLMKKKYWFDKRWVTMNFWDAMGMAAMARENGLSIHGNDIYPMFKMVDGEARVVNLGKSSESKARIAKKEGVVFGPPQYSDPLRRDWPKEAYKVKPWWTEQDLGITCTINMYVEGRAEPSIFTCWLSEWYEGLPTDTERRAYWDKNPWWMLQVRSKDKAITLASGVGQSDLQEEAPAPVQEILPPEKPEIKTAEKEKRK